MTSQDDLVGLRALLDTLKQFGVTEYEDGDLKLKLTPSYENRPSIDPALEEFLKGSKLGLQNPEAEGLSSNQFRQFNLKGFRKNDE